MKIYFAGAIRGGRQKIEDYKKIIEKLESYGEVLTKHIADSSITDKGENNLTLKQIYERDIEWLEKADLVIAEVSVPSLGIGYEIGHAEALQKKIICFYEMNENNAALSAMIGGNNNLIIYKYNNVEEILKIIDNELR